MKAMLKPVERNEVEAIQWKSGVKVEGFNEWCISMDTSDGLQPVRFLALDKEQSPTICGLSKNGVEEGNWIIIHPTMGVVAVLTDERFKRTYDLI